jgi:hypothetical protein
MPNGPIVATDNLDSLADRYCKLGFVCTTRALQPTGVATRLIEFQDNFIELTGVANEDPLDEPGNTGLPFRRHIVRQLDRNEGVALLALHSDDITADIAELAERGLLLDEERPRLSCFLREQRLADHRTLPQHPNGAEAITRITYAVGEPFAVWSRFKQIWGEPALTDINGGFSVAIPGGELLLLDRMTIEGRYFQTPLPQGWREEPCAVAITIRVRSLAALHMHMMTAAIPFLMTDEAMHIAPHEAGNVMLEFVE